MAKFIQNDIEFTATNGMKLSSKITRSSNGDFSDAAEGVDPLVNAVEIDWNAAQLGEETISNNCESHCSMIVLSIAA